MNGVEILLELKIVYDENGNGIAYRKTEGHRSPGIIYLPGFLSNMQGEKPLAVEKYCKEKGHPYIRQVS